MSEFWCIIIPAAALIVCFPFLRIGVKRLILAAKLRNVCRREGFALMPAHPFWMFGRRDGAKCDAYVVTKETVLCVKLFDVPNNHFTLLLNDDRTYCFRRNVPAGWVPVPTEGKRRRLAEIDFRHGMKDEWQDKTPLPVLLIHPICDEVRFRAVNGEEHCIVPGGNIHGMILYPLASFLADLGKDNKDVAAAQ